MKPDEQREKIVIEKFSYVFIIGAGASYPYNFPLGQGLYDSIRDNYYKRVKKYFSITDTYIPGSLANLPEEVEEFIEQLKLASGVSIDKYLNINSKFNEIGTRAITTEIYHSEVLSNIPLNKEYPKGDWYTYLFRKLIESLDTVEDLLNIYKNKISFITFNYDRSLEHYLFENLYGLLKNANVTKENVAQSFKKIEIIHVFGKIGYLPWEKGIYTSRKNIFREEESILSYGVGGYHPVDVGIKQNRMIELMYTERKQTQDLLRAHEIIKGADRVLFLGFGYDQQNLELLNIPKLLDGKRIYGTAFKATKNEIQHIKSLLSFKDVQDKSEIYYFDCLMLLREHLV